MDIRSDMFMGVPIRFFMKKASCEVTWQGLRRVSKLYDPTSCCRCIIHNNTIRTPNKKNNQTPEHVRTLSKEQRSRQEQSAVQAAAAVKHKKQLDRDRVRRVSAWMRQRCTVNEVFEILEAGMHGTYKH